MIHECKRGDKLSVKFTDPETGKEVPHVFYYDTSTHRIGRLLLNDQGETFKGPNSPFDAEFTWEKRPLIVEESNG